MEPFVTRIGDVTIERVVPKSGPGSGGGTVGKETKEPVPPPSVSLAKRDVDGNDAISVSEDLQIFLKPPLSGVEKGATGGSKHDGRKSRDSSVGGSRETSLGRGDDRTANSGTDESDASESDDNEDRHSEIMDEEDEMLLPQAVDKMDTSDFQQRNKSDEQSEVMSDNKMTASSIVESHGQTALQNSIETGAVSLEPVRTEQDKTHADGVGGGNSASDGKKILEEGKGKTEEDGERGSAGSDTNKRKAQQDSGVIHKKKKTSLSGKDGKDKGGSSSSDSEDSKDDSKSNLMERKLSNMRRNIREVMSENQLDEETLAAQRQEMERLRRVQEQQRIIREVQRQIALNRQNNKTQTRVISLLQGNSSLLKQIPSTSSSGSSGSTQVRLPNTVLVKLASGSGQGSGSGVQTNKKVFELLRVQKGSTSAVPRPGARGSAISRTVLAKPRGVGPQVHMMTPSVSIAPVMSSPRVPAPSESESEGEEDSEREMLARAAALRKVAGKGKGKDVVTISSSSDDDDCILLSEPSSGDEGDPVDDPTNSGMHTNDLYNIPDEQGRVLVNVGHPAEEPELFLAPQIARIIKPHQIGGVRFLFDNVVESLSRFNTSTGFGCILAHSMGLGKTLQVVSFCDVFLRHTSARTVLCIMPINTLQNWLAEFNMWLPAPAKDSSSANSSSNTVGSNNSNSSSDNIGSTTEQQQSILTDSSSDIAVETNSTPESRPRNFALHVLNDSHKSMAARSKVIQEWYKGGGVLLIGYELYRQLSLKRPNKANSKKRRRKHQDEVVDVDADEKNKALLDDMHSALVKPGPDLVICDEGHRIKNSHASISQALKQIRSKRRVVLTGYPLQNNLLEYWCMVDFVRPNYLGTKTEFCNMFERPIQNGQCIDSTPQDIRLMRYRAHVLHSLLEGFVQRRSHSVLQVSLPQKEEYVLLLRLTQFQRKLYDTFMNEVVRTKAVPNPLKAFAVCCKIWNHPDVLYYFLKKRNSGEDVDLDLEEATTASSTPLVSGVAASPRGGPAKRGRGRGSRNPSGQGKRERKGPAPFRQLGSNKPAATITPQTANLASGGTVGNTSSSNSGTNTNNSPQCGAVPSMGCMGTGTPMQQDPHANNQPYNIMGQQNQSYNNPGSYTDMQHYNPNSASPYGYPTNPPSSSYDPNYSNNSYNSSNSSYGSSNHNTATSQYGGPGNYYSPTGGSANDQQGNYENNTMESYYPTAGSNHHGNSYQNPATGNSTPYWQQHGNHGYYQHVSNASGNGNPNQYYSGNGGSSYAGTNNGETGESSYYMGHHPHSHQQGQYGDYGSREQGSMYHGMNTSGFMGEMGQNTIGNPNSSGLVSMGESSQSQSNNMLNMPQNSSMPNPNTMGNLQTSQNLSMNNMQNPTGSQNPMANQTTMGNAQGAMNSMQTSMEGNIVNKNQNPVGTPQSPIGNQQNTAGQQHSAVGNQSPMGTQNSVGTPQTIIGNQQNTMGTAQNSMVNPHNPVAVQQNPMGSTHNSMGASQNPVGTPQPLTGTQQNPVGTPQQLIGTQQNPMGTPQNVMINSQNPMGNCQSMMGTPNALGAPQNSMGMSQNLMGPTQNMMGTLQNPMVPPQSSMGTPQSAMGSVPNLMAGPQNSMGNPQNPIGSSQSAVGTSQSTMGNPQNPMSAHQNPVTSPQNVMAVSQNPMGPPQSSIGTPHSPVGSQQNMLGTLKNPMAAPNAMGVPQNQIGTSQDSAGNAQNLMGNPQNPINSFQGSVGNNSQNLNIMQNTHNHMHGHPEIGGNSGNSMQDTYGRMSGMDPNNSSQNTAYDAGNNMSSYRHQQIFQNSNNRPCLQQGNSSCGSSADNLYGSMPGNVQYLGENMGNVPICKTEPGSQNTLSNMMTGEGSSSGTGGPHGNSELSLYGPPSGGIPYPNRWDDNSGSGRFLSASQQSEENKGKCEDNIKEESQNMSTDGSTLIANKDKLKFGEEEKGHEQKNSCNPQLKSGDSSDQRISCEKQPLSREGYSSNGDPAKCLTEMKPVDSGTSTEQDGKSSTVTSCNMQQNGNIPPSSLKTEDKISLNCSNETQTDISPIPTNNYGNLNVKSDMSTQHNAFKMESGAFKSDGQAFERNSSPHLQDVKEYELGNDSKDRKANDSANGRQCESMVESKDASCGTQNFECPKDLNLNEGKQVVELGAGAARNMGGREDPGIPYDWATELLKNYIPGSIENSAKMEVLFCILEESMALGDRMLVFSQSLFTLNLIEDFLQRNNLPGRQEKWARNCNYYRLDGSTSALEREKLINEYNSNPNIHLFLVSTRAGSLGINLVGANRVIVFDASWNPCHDTQAVCRVYRYGQKKPCFVYRLVMDNCLEKKIYDRQINKQGMADRVVDECNPDAHLSIKEVTNLCWDNEQDTEPRDFSAEKDKYIDVVLQKLLDKFSSRLSKEPFQHESLLVDRKEKKLSQAEKRLAKRSYELEKQANINYSHRPQYSYYPGSTSAVGNAGIQGTGLQIRAIRTDGSGGVMPKPVASVRPMQAELSQQLERGQANRSTVTTLNTTGRSRWIPAEVWQRQGMSAQEMTLPLDVVIPTNSPDRASIVLKAGQRVMVLKSPKGIYMQLENGKIIAIRTAFKVGGAGKGSAAQQQECKPPLEKAEMNTPEYKKESNAPTINRTVNMAKVSNVLPFKNNSAITIIPKNTALQQRGAGKPMSRVGGNSSGGGILKQDVTVKPWGPRIGASVDVAPVTMGGNKNISSQQPMVQARPYFHRTSANNSTDMGTAKPYFHHDASSDHLGMMGHQTSDEGSSGAENMSSTPCAEDKDGVDGGVLKSPSSDDFNQDNSMSSHAFRSIEESNISNKSSYDSHMGDDMLHDSGTGMGMTYGNHADQGIQEPNINSSYGRQMGQDTRDPPVSANRSFRRHMDQGLQGAGNVGHPFARQTDQRAQETSANLSRGYGRQVDQGVHDASSMSHRYGRHMEQGYHDTSAGANHGFGRQLDQGIQETGGINRSFGRQSLEGITYNQQSQARSYDEHKDANFNRSDSSSGGRYGQTDTESGSNRNFHGTYEDSWQQGQVFRGMSRVSDGTHGHGGGMADSRSYHQPFKSSSHGVEKHSLPDNSTREQQRNSFPDYSQRQQLQEPESPTFQTEVTDSATGGNDSGVEILPLPTSTFTPASKEPLPQQSTNRSTPQGKTTSLKNYRHNSFSAQLHSREVDSSTGSDNTTAPITRTLQEKPLSGDHYMKSPQQTSYPADIKSPSGFQQSNEDLKVSNQNLTMSGYPQGGNVGSVFLGTGNPSVGQHTLPSSKTRQKNAPNIGRFNSEVSSGGNFSAGGMPSAIPTKSKRANSRSEQQHYEFESSDATSDAGRINPQQQPHGKPAGRNQMYPLQPQAYHAHTSPQQAQSQTPPASNPASIATASVSKKGRGNKNTSSDRSPSYSVAASNTESDLHRNADSSSSKNQSQQPSQNVPVQMPQSAPVFPPNPQYPASDGSSSSPVYGHQQYYPTPGYYGGFGGPQQPPVAFGGNPYYSGESQYGTGRGAHVDQSVPPGNKDIHKGNQSQAGTSPTQQQQQQQQSVQPLPQSTTPAKTQQTPSGIGSQKKEQSSQLGNSTPASDSPTKVAATATNPSTPTTTRDMTSPSSASGGSRSGNNSARSTPATVANTNISQEPNSPQLHFNAPTTSASSTTLENRSPVQYNSSMTTNPAPLDPKSPLQYNSSVTSGNSSSSAASSHQYNSSATGVNSSASAASSLDYNSSATSSNFTAGTGSTPQGGLIPPPPHQSPYEPMMLGGYPAGAPGTGYAAPPPPPGMGYGSYSNPANQYEADYARASMYSAFHRPDPHPHPFAPGHPPGFLPSPQSTNYYPQNMYAPTPYGTPDPAYYSNPFLNAMHQHPYPTLPGAAQNPGSHPQ